MKIVKCFGGLSMLLVLSSTAMVSEEKSSSKDVLFGKYMKYLQSVTFVHPNQKRILKKTPYIRKSLIQSKWVFFRRVNFEDVTPFISSSSQLPLYGREALEESYKHNCPNSPSTTFISESKVLKFTFKPKDRHSKYQLHHIIPLAYGGKNIWTNIIPMTPEVHKQIHESEIYRTLFPGRCQFLQGRPKSGMSNPSMALDLSESDNFSGPFKPSEISSGITEGSSELSFSEISDLSSSFRPSETSSSSEG